MAQYEGIVARTLAAIKYARTGVAPTEWFGPGQALKNQAPAEVMGRAFDYPSYSNINYLPRKIEAVGFKKMKALATHCEPLKLVMARQRDLAKALEWTVKTKVKGDTASTVDPGIIKITAAFERPDRAHDWAQWLGAMIDQVFVYDALSIYARPTQGGELYSLDIIDGSTITPLIDQTGRPPMAPDECYKQVLKGMPAVSYTADELIYYPENYRVDHIYGQSRVEQIITIAETQIMRAKSHLGYFTHGNIGDGYFTAPELFQPDQIASLERNWNAQMSGDLGQRLADRRQVPWLPAGTEFHATKVDIFQEQFDEWLIRLICFGFGVSPTPFVKQTGLGNSSADTDKETAEEGGIAQLMQFVRRLMNHIIATKFMRPDLEFSWVEDREMNPEVAARIDDVRLKNGSRTIDEVRDRNGESPLANGLGKVPLIYSTGIIRLEDAIAEPAPPPAALAPGDDPADPEDPASKPGAEKDAPPAAKADLAKAATTTLEAKLAKIITTFLSARAAEAAAVLGDALGLAKVNDDFGDRADRAFDDIDWDWTALATVAEPVLVSITVASAEEAANGIGLFDKATMKRVAARATAWAHERAATMVGMKWVDGELVANPKAEWSISETTRTQLRAAVETAMEEGQSNTALAKTIREATTFSKERAIMIARSETAIADVQGSIAGWKASGLVAGKQWLASADCCELCAALDGTIVAIDEEFEGGDAPLHPNCECDLLPVLPEDMPDADATDTD